MKDRSKPIPVPLRQRLIDMRMRVLPAVVFFSSVVVIGLLWKQHLVAPSFIGQAEPVLANVSSHLAGILTDCQLKRFQMVRKGEVLGRVIVADAKLLQSSRDVIQAEIQMLRLGLDASQQRASVNYNQLRLNWMKYRADAAIAELNLGLTQAELRRTEELFQEKIVSQSVLDLAQATHSKAQSEFAELTKLLKESEATLAELQITNSAAIAKINEAPIEAAIALQESKLRQIVAEMSPVTLHAPIDGIVSSVFFLEGQPVTAGEPVVAISSIKPARIVGYLRPPVQVELQKGMTVEVRTRGVHPQIGLATVEGVGTQFEVLPETLTGRMRLTQLEMALPVDITVPPNLKINAGELVDVFVSNIR